MKRILILLMALSIFFVTGCGKKAEVNNKKDNSGAKTETVDKKAHEEKAADGNKATSEEKAPVKKEQPATNKAETKEESKPANEDKATAKSDVQEAQTPQEAPTIGGTDLESAIDEFNNTEDPKRREELREELEDFFAMFEGETVTAE